MRYIIWFLVVCAAPVAAAEQAAAQPFPLWDGKETIVRYAQRVGLPPTKTLDLGNGVTLELILIPAGKFRTGTPEPELADEGPPATEASLWWWGFCLSAIAFVGSLLGMFIRSRRKDRPPQFSLAFFTVFVVLFSGSVLSYLQWSDAEQALRKVRDDSRSTLEVYKNRDPELPLQDVVLNRPFYLGRYEVTQ